MPECYFCKTQFFREMYNGPEDCDCGNNVTRREVQDMPPNEFNAANAAYERWRDGVEDEEDDQ